MDKRLLMAEHRYGNTASRALGATLCGWDVQWVEPYWTEGCGRIRRSAQFRARTGPDIISWNRAIIHAVEKFNPTVLWAESPLFIFPSTLDEVKLRYGTLAICAYSDDPRDPAKQSRHFEKGKLFYDIIFTTKDELLLQLRTEGVKCIEKFWKGFDPERITRLSLNTDEQRQWQSDLLFVGHIDRVGRVSARQSAFERLAVDIPNFALYGASWGKLNVSEKLRSCIRPYQLDGIDYVRAIRASKIALQLPSRLARDTHSSRSVEIPACGTMLLAERTVDHLILFEEDKEAVFFSCYDELVDKARFYIKADAARERIADAGFRRCQERGYSNYTRMKQMLATVERFYERAWVDECCGSDQ